MKNESEVKEKLGHFKYMLRRTKPDEDIRELLSLIGILEWILKD